MLPLLQELDALGEENLKLMELLEGKAVGQEGWWWVVAGWAGEQGSKLEQAVEACTEHRNMCCQHLFML